jgi:hypothetical protein
MLAALIISNTLAIALILTALTAITLLTLGIRGKRLNDHPICRRCAFDLVGVYPGAQQCTDCGARLTRRHAIRHGRRRPRRALIVAGLVPLAILASLGALFTWAVATNYDLNKLKPTWLLVREAESAAPSDGALAELIVRLNADELGPAAIDRLVARAMRIQADTTIPWRSAYGDIVETARTLNHVDDEQWETYALQCFEGDIRVRERIRPGDRLPVEAVIRARAGPRPTFRAQVQVGPLRVDGVEAEGGWDVGDLLSTGTTTRIAQRWFMPPTLAPGPHEVDVELHFQIFEAGAPPGAPSISERTLTFRRTIDVVPRSEDVIALVKDPSIAERIARGASATIGPDPRGLNRLTITLADVPLAISASVTLRRGDQEWNVGNMIAYDNSRSFHTGLRVPDGVTPGVVDVIITPNPTPPRGSIDIIEIWGEPIVIEDVTVPD